MSTYIFNGSRLEHRLKGANLNHFQDYRGIFDQKKSLGATMILGRNFGECDLLPYILNVSSLLLVYQNKIKWFSPKKKKEYNKMVCDTN